MVFVHTSKMVFSGYKIIRVMISDYLQDSRRELPGVDFATRELSLPCGWWVDDEDIYRICDFIKNYHK